MTPSDQQELLALLADITFWGQRLDTYVSGLSEQDFQAANIRCDAACWCIVCIGEAAGRIGKLRPDMTSEYPALELFNAYAMRNRLAHGYASLDVGILWHTACVSVPKLVAAAKSASDELSAQS